jgi:hypothetical protein
MRRRALNPLDPKRAIIAEAEINERVSSDPALSPLAL